MNITVILPRFGISGVPLAQFRLARALVERGHSVTLIIGFLEANCALPSLDGLQVECWNLPKVRNMLWPLVRYFWSEKPDVIFSAEDHLNTIVSMAAFISGSNVKISSSSRVTPFDTYSGLPFTKGWLLKHLASVMMGRADVLTCVSKDMVAQYRQIFTSPPHVCVYNIVDDTSSRERMFEPVEHAWLVDKKGPVLVAAGRLAPWKGFADLIEAMSLVVARRDVRLLILGDGPLRDELQALIEVRGLGEVVALVGYVNNPLKYFNSADVFVLASLLEGLPNVLVEAMMCGCTPVSTDCPTGPREVLQDGKYGYLVPMHDPASMAAAIEEALDAPIPKSLLDEAVAPFEENRVISRHFEILGLCEKSYT